MRPITGTEMTGILKSLKNQDFHVNHIADDPEEVRGSRSIHCFGKGFEAVEVGEGFSLDFRTYGEVKYVDNYIDGMFEAALLDDYTVGGVSDLILWDNEGEEIDLNKEQIYMIEKAIKEKVTV